MSASPVRAAVKIADFKARAALPLPEQCHERAIS
jgi:hypothetical protein